MNIYIYILYIYVYIGAAIVVAAVALATVLPWIVTDLAAATTASVVVCMCV